MSRGSHYRSNPVQDPGGGQSSGSLSPEPLSSGPHTKPGFAGVAWPLWLILGISVAFLAAVRIYAAHVESRWTGPVSTEAGLPALLTHSPSGPASASALRLSWEAFPAAYQYRLRITADTGEIVFDGLPVFETAWTPPEEALPALPPGRYLWQVEATDAQGRALARSFLAPFDVLN